MSEEYNSLKSALVESMSENFNLKIEPELINQLVDSVKDFINQISSDEQLEDDGQKFLRQVDTFLYKVTGDDKIIDKYNEKQKSKRFDCFKDFIKVSKEAFHEINKLNPESSRFVLATLTATKVMHHLVHNYSEELGLVAN